MKINKIFSAGMIAAFAASVLSTGCADTDLYDNGAPEWLADSVAAAAAKNSASQEEVVIEGLLEDVYDIGKDDFSSPFFTLGKTYVVPNGGVWQAQFNLTVNPDNKYFKNFFLVLNAIDGETLGAEYGVIRFDNDPTKNSEWGDNIDRSLVGGNFKNSSGDDDIDPNVQKMNGKITVTVEHKDGGLFIEMTNGTLTKTFTQTTPFPDDKTAKNPVAVRVGIEASVVKFLGTTIEPIGGCTSAKDKQPVSMVLNNLRDGFPMAENLDLDELLKNVTATVTFEEGVVKNVEAKDLTFNTIPDLTTPGEKQLLVAFAKTFKGETTSKPVMTTATFTITEEFTSIEIVPQDAAPTYYYTSGTTEIKPEDFDATAFIKNVLGKNSSQELALTKEEYTVDVAIPATLGDDIVITAKYKELSATLNVAVKEQRKVDIWGFKGAIIEGKGNVVEDETFGQVFVNDNAAQRTSYLLLPEGTIPDCSESKAMTISFWVNGNGKAYMWSPLFAAYAAAPVDNSNTFPMFIIQGRGLLQTNIEGWNDFTGAQNTTKANTESIAYLEDNQWHLVTVTITDKHAEFIVDNTVVNAWDYTGEGDGQVTTGFLSKGHEMLTYICLGGNQAWGWGDPDTGYKYAKLKTYDRVISAEEIAKRIADKE